MNKKTNFRNKAVISSIFVVAIMCLAATAVPMTNGSQTLEIKKNLEENSLNNKFSEDDFLFLKSELTSEKNNVFKILKIFDNKKSNSLLDELHDLSYRDFERINSYIGSPNIFDDGNQKMLINRIIEMIKIIQNPIIFDGEKYNLNKRLLDFSQNDNLYENKEITNLDDDFQWYWGFYEEVLDHWERFASENWQQWFVSIKTYTNYVQFFSIVLLFGSIALCLVHEYWATILGLGLMVLILGVLFDHANYLLDGYNQYAWMIENQVEIIVHVFENTSEKKGIGGLSMDKSIISKNNDAIANCDGERGKHESLFTYYPGQAWGTDEEGWYCLGNRNIPEDQELDKKAPHPPGDWTIIIEETDEYEGDIRYINESERYGTEVIEIALNPK